MVECHFKSTFGIECFGCGAQRSIILLIEGNIIESLKLFPALLPLLFLIVYTILHLIFKFKVGARVIVFAFSLTSILMLANFIVKQVALFS